MPWKECQVEDERLRFVARLQDGESMTALCIEFGISRKTGYKIRDRYKDYGLHGLTDRSRRPYRHANQLPLVLEKQIVGLKREYPQWGAPKIREKLRGRCGPLQCPAISTVHAVLDRHGLVQRRRRRRYRATGTTLTAATEPNALWCADVTGEFQLANFIRQEEGRHDGPATDTGRRTWRLFQLWVVFRGWINGRLETEIYPHARPAGGFIRQ